MITTIIRKSREWLRSNTTKKANIAVSETDMMLNRQRIAEAFLKGDGIEIGALYMPLKVPAVARVKYVDRMTVTELRKQYPELDNEQLVNVDILDDGEQLASIADSSQDFVIANHFLEHCQNPIQALLNLLRVVKLARPVYLAIPDKRYSFDIDRPITPFEHLMRDYTEGPESSRREHFEEWARFVNKVKDEAEVQKQVAILMEMNYSIHFHVWTQDEMLKLLQAVKKMVYFDIEFMLRNVNEVIFVLRKVHSP
jgi:predicted SAM-dependent methyltransferase